MLKVIVGGRRVKVDPRRSIGKGGEADVYDLGGGRALKLFKPPGHPDYALDPVEQEGARRRIAEHQQKLLAFPTGFPESVIVPLDLARDGAGAIAGYAMRCLPDPVPLHAMASPSFPAGRANEVVSLLRSLHGAVSAVHRVPAVIGDFNDLNVLVSEGKPFLIDADSFQFGPYLCRVYTDRFVDPLLCDPLASRPIMVRPASADSDWYAFTAMLVASLLHVDPFGGVHCPKDPGKRVAHGARPLRRISIFHPDVRLPKIARRPDVLPDDLLQHLHLVLEKDRRGPWPTALLERLRFASCATCGGEHARARCPACAVPAPFPRVLLASVRGKVTSTVVSRTAGRFLVAGFQRGRFVSLCSEGGSLRREDGSSVLHGALGPREHAAILGHETLVARGRTLVRLAPGAAPRSIEVDSCDGTPTFAVTDVRCYWVHEGTLFRDGDLGPERTGEVLAGQTRMWAGPTFGFGVYRAGELCRAFLFHDAALGINDSAALPRIRGQLVDARAVFGRDACWFLTTTVEGASTIHRCAVLDARGRLLASADAEPGDGSWLGTLPHPAPFGRSLLVATDDGISRVDIVAGGLEVTRSFPDAAPFVDAGSRLAARPDGVYVLDAREARKLTVG
ncbi:MAG: hypothetical protein U0166_04580 [Acidobacteriota bacterium]